MCLALHYSSALLRKIGDNTLIAGAGFSFVVYDVVVDP